MGEGTNREISTEALLMSWVRNWKKIVIAAVICGVFLCGMQVYKNRTVSTESDIQTNENTAPDEDTTSKLELYKEQYEIAKEQKQKYESELEQYEAYKEQSFVMNMDYNHVANTMICYYLDNNYMLNTESILQNRDNILSLQEAYVKSIQKLGKQEIKNYYGNHVIDSDIEMMLHVEADNSGQFITMRVLGTNEEDLQEITSAINVSLQEVKDNVTDVLGENDIQIFSEEYSTSLSEDIVNIQNANDEKENNLKSSILSKENEARNYNDAYIAAGGESIEKSELPTDQTVENIEFRQKSMVEVAIQGFIVGTMLGICISLIVLTIAFFMSVKLQNVTEIEKLMELSFLGTFYVTNSRFEKLEKKKWVKHGMLLNNNEEMLIAKIVDVCRKNPNIDRIVFCSSISDFSEKIIEILDNLNISIEVRKGVGNILLNASDYSEICENDGIIILEQLRNSELNCIEAEVKEIRKKGNPIIGYIVI